jgi:oxygen-independent coproporphyrinogen-3 oxidase
MTSDVDIQTTAGNYFVANYPPFSAWREDQAHLVEERLQLPPKEGIPLGLYVHIPFCRKRCDFCYFRVYTDNDAARVRRYSEALVRELEIYARKPAIRSRKPRFVYFGGALGCGARDHLRV